MRYAAILVDSRPQPDLDKAVEEHREFLPKDWDCIVFTCKENAYVQRDGVKVVEIPQIWANTFLNYQNFMASTLLWEQLKDYDRVLTFQQDSRLLRPGVEEFLEWDWIGAPWKLTRWNTTGALRRFKWRRFGRRVGNGGLSIRNPKIMLAVAENIAWRGEHEDIFFVENLRKFGGRTAPLRVARRFSCETIFALGTVGCHAIERYFSKEQVRMVLEQYKRRAELNAPRPAEAEALS